MYRSDDNDPDGADCPEENPFGPNASQPKLRDEDIPMEAAGHLFLAAWLVALHDVIEADEFGEMVDPACAW